MSAPQFVRNGSNNDTFGTEELSTWPFSPGVCRFQTRSPEFARKLSQRSGARLVAFSVNGGFLRIYQEEIEPWRARQLIARYLMHGETIETLTNGAFSGLESGRSSS